MRWSRKSKDDEEMRAIINNIMNKGNKMSENKRKNVGPGLKIAQDRFKADNGYLPEYEEFKEENRVFTHRVVILNDGETWSEGEGSLLDITSEAFELLCDGVKPNQLSGEVKNKDWHRSVGHMIVERDNY